jgi:hypothetical protein
VRKAIAGKSSAKFRRFSSMASGRIVAPCSGCHGTESGRNDKQGGMSFGTEIA